MRQVFAAFDDALIERVFQPLSNLLADTLGLNRFRMASVCVELSAIAWVLSQAPDLSAAVLGWEAGSALLHVALLLLGLTALLSLRRLFRRVPSRRANPLRSAMQPHRAVVLLLLLTRLVGLQAIGIADAADLVMLGLVTFALYLGACAEPPPVHRVSALPQAA